MVKKRKPTKAKGASTARWSVSLLKHTPAKLIGEVDAATAEEAIEEAAKQIRGEGRSTGGGWRRGASGDVVEMPSFA